MTYGTNADFEKLINENQLAENINQVNSSKNVDLELG